MTTAASPPAPAQSPFVQLMMALCCRAIQAAGVSIPTPVASALEAVAATGLSAAEEELKKVAPEVAAVADRVEEAALTAAAVLADVSGAEALAAMASEVAAVAAKVEEVAETVGSTAEPAPVPAPPSSETLSVSPPQDTPAAEPAPPAAESTVSQ